MRISFLQPVASLQCHCGIKNDEFRHEHIGQLNAYVSYYAENEMQPGDNPPVGILLCTHKGKKMVEYALGSMDNHLLFRHTSYSCQTVSN